MRRSCSLASVRVAMMAGTEQPNPMSMGTKERPEADFSQELIHDEGHPGHIAAVLQQRQEEEQHHNDGQKERTLPTPAKIPSMIRGMDGGV